MKGLIAACAAVALAGCASFSEDGGFDTVQEAVKERTGGEARWVRSEDDANSVRARVKELLAKPLSAEDAAQIALLNNPGLQATYAELGISEADLVQAGRMTNPHFAYMRVGEGEHRTLEWALTFPIIDLLTIPMRTRIEARRFEQTKLSVASRAVGTALAARSAWVRAVAAEQSLRLSLAVAPTLVVAVRLLSPLLVPLERFRPSTLVGEGTVTRIGARKNVPASIGNTDHLSFTAIGVPAFNPIQDYVDYDVRTHHTNVDTYERVLEKNLGELEAQKTEENRRVEAEMERLVAEYRARIQANNDEIAKEKERFYGWRLQKQQEEKKLPEKPAPKTPWMESAAFAAFFYCVMIVAAIMIAITYKLKQPSVIGYIIAGIIIGPFTPPFAYVSDLDTLNALAEIGIIMLLFVIGTEFPMAKLRSVGRISIVVALAESLGTLFIVFFTAQYLGFPFFESLFLGLALSITSTVVTIKILEELGMVKDKSSTLILGISIVEDILAISILAVLQSIASAGGDLSVPTIAVSIGIVGAFVGGVLFLGSRYLPKVIDRAGKTNDYALLLIVILGFAFGLSFLANSIGLSVATGAFLAGVLVAESNSAAVARILTLPLRDMFAAIFFISIGALMDISLVPAFIPTAAVLILTSFGSKFLIITGILAKARYDTVTALKTGLGMSAAKGELSLVVVKGGQDVGVVGSSILPLLGVITIVTTFMAPYVIRFGHRLKPPDERGEKKEDEPYG